MQRVKTVDETGYPLTVLLPDHIEIEYASEGIPVSVDLREIFPDVPPYFLAKLQDVCASKGLITRADFLAPGARAKIIECLRVVLQYDASKIIEFLKQELKNDR